jgi:large subunit ribosomal protein L29
MKARELRNLSPEELKDRLKELRKQLMELNFKKRTAHVEKPHFFRRIRRDIAKILTVMKEKRDG